MIRDFIRREAFHIFLLNLMFMSLLIITYYNDSIMFSPGLGGLFLVTPFFWLFTGAMVVSFFLFFIVFYFLFKKIREI